MNKKGIFLQTSSAVVNVNCRAVYKAAALFVRRKAYKTCVLCTICRSVYKNVFDMCLTCIIDINKVEDRLDA